MTRAELLVIAKAPVPGRVKTRLCPPWTPEQAACLAAAALDDTLATGSAAAVDARTLLLDGVHAAPAGWRTLPQRGAGLVERLINGYADSARDGHAQLLIGMDTPQVTPALIGEAFAALAAADAVLGPAVDGGWWALGLRDPADAEALRDVPTSTPDTGRRTRAALEARGLRVASLPALRDVDTAADAVAVLPSCPPEGAFARASLPLIMKLPDRSAPFVPSNFMINEGYAR